MESVRRTLTIQLRSWPNESGNEATEVIWSLGDLSMSQRLACGRGKLRKLRHQLAKAYDLVHAHGGSPQKCQISRGNLRRVLREAHKIGREFFGGGKELLKLREWLRLFHGQPLEWQIEAAPESMFALDMFPLGWLFMNCGDFSDYLHYHPDLTTESLASMLPCWQWPVIRRFLEMGQPSRHPLPRADKVRMAFVGDGAPVTVSRSLRRDMQRAHAKLKRHRVLSAAYEIEKPWPDDPEEQTFTLVSALARHLVNHDIMPRGCRYPQSPAAITHFYCHGSTSVDQAHDQTRAKIALGMHFELHIGQLRKEDRHHQITASALKTYIEEHRAVKGTEMKKQRTLIFMNACAGGMQAQMDDVALASVFLRNGHPAFIGTETNIDVDTAAQISACFYECLLDSIPAHHALWMARRRMTCETGRDRKAFPAALLYSCYGIPDCHFAVGQPPLIRLSPPSGNIKDLFFPAN